MDHRPTATRPTLDGKSTPHFAAWRRLRELLGAASLLVMIVTATRLAYSDAAPDIVVIVNAANGAKTLPASEVKAYYVGDKVVWPGGDAVKLYTLPPDSPAGVAFFRDILHVAPSRFRRSWQEHTFAGRPGAAPEEVATSEAIVAKVAQSGGGIGFLTKGEAGSLPATVHAVAVP